MRVFIRDIHPMYNPYWIYSCLNATFWITLFVCCFSHVKAMPSAKRRSVCLRSTRVSSTTTSLNAHLAVCVDVVSFIFLLPTFVHFIEHFSRVRKIYIKNPFCWPCDPYSPPLTPSDWLVVVPVDDAMTLHIIHQGIFFYKELLYLNIRVLLYF